MGVQQGHMPDYAIERTAPGALPVVLVALLTGLVAAPAAPATPGRGRCAATITASFADSCRDFAAHSSKDISFVELHHLDGRVVKHRRINRHDYAFDGGAGDEIDFAIVKSGTTIEQFDCVQSNGAPTALLVIKTPPVDQTLEHCYDFFAGGLACEQSSPRTDWTDRTEIPDDGGDQSGWLSWGCGGLGAPCRFPSTVTFRGTLSSDPDSDIGTWSLDFGDGTSMSGGWGTAPPTEVAHEYANPGVYVVTLTVTDSAGQSDSDVLVMAFVDQTPD